MHKIKKIVILEIGGIGDLIMASPTLVTLINENSTAIFNIYIAKRVLPFAKFYFEKYRTHKFKFIPFETENHFLIRNIKNLLNIIRLNFLNRPDLIFDLSAIESKNSSLLRRFFIILFQSKISIGRNTNGLGTFFKHSYQEKLVSKTHEVDRKLQTIFSYKSYKMSYKELLNPLTNENEKNPKFKLIGINIGAYRDNRRWPIDNYIQLIEKICLFNKFRIKIFAGKNDIQQVKKLKSEFDNKVDFIIQKPFPEVVQNINECFLFITNDSGLMHLTASIKIPIISLFGPENFYRYMPWGDFEKVILKYIPTDKENNILQFMFLKNSINNISVNDVLEEVIAFTKTKKFTKKIKLIHY